MTEYQSTDKRGHILEVAQQLFAQNGFTATSVRDIAKEAGVNIAMISYYFGSKEKLLEAIFLAHSEVVGLQIKTVLHNEQMSPMDKLEKLIDGFVEKYFSQQSFHRLAQRMQLRNTDSPIMKVLHEMKRSNLDLLHQIVTEGQKKGDFKKNIDIPLLTATMLGTANQLMTTKAFYKEVNKLESLSEEAFQKHIKKKLSLHLKSIFKVLLNHEL